MKKHNFICYSGVLFFCLFPILCCFIKNFEGTCFASKKKEFLSQTTIDTLIQQAFVNLNASTGTDVPDAEARHRQAVIDAKETADKLKALAKGDPNEKYVLWKVNELEHQVFLEERDMVLKKAQIGKKEENNRISEFNKELGKKRPDFFALNTFCHDMIAIDRLKEKEMQRSLDQRSDAISREAVRTIEKALITGDIAISQKEFDYCSKNRTMLKIPLEKFSWFAIKIPAQNEAIQQKSVIDQELSITGPFLSHNKIGILRKSVSELQGKLYPIAQDLPMRDRGAYAVKINSLINAVNRKEDSLVTFCLSVLKAKGVDAALDYLEHVLRTCGVSEEKIGQTNARILHKSGLDKNRSDTAVDRQLEIAAVPGNNNNGIDLGDVRQIAKKKAQQRADSIRVVEEEKARNRRVEQARADSIKQAMEMQAKQAALLENEKKANDIAMDIYALIGENKTAEAHKKFTVARKNLEKYLSKDSFGQLQAMVLQASETPGQRDDKNENSAVVLVSQSPHSNMDNQAPEGPGQNSDADREKAKQVIIQIYGLIEINKIEAAYKRFMQVRRPLEKFLDKEAFAMLETTVIQAYESLGKQGH
jgi:hypothetical protein